MSTSNNTINLPIEILGLSEVEIETVKINAKDNEIYIDVISSKKEIPCRICQRLTEAHGRGRELTLRHLPVFGMRTYIRITPRRGICPYCDENPTTTQRHDWYDLKSKYTKAYEQHVLFELINSTVADVSEKEDIDYHSVEGLVDKYIEQEINFAEIKSLCVVGLDEISLKKGHRDFVTLVTYRDGDKVRLLSIIEGRKKAEIEAFLRKIPKRLTKTIVAVCCDLYDGYMNAVKDVFGNKIPVVADRFHVSKLYRRSLVTLRKAELKRLRKQLSSDEYNKLKSAIALLKKSRDYFTDDENRILAPLFSYSPKLKLAYMLSHKLTSIFNSAITQQQAKEKMMAWIDEVMTTGLNCFNRFIKTLNKYIDVISNYFIERNSSGFVEGFNNKVKVLKRRCYGLANKVRLFQRIILDTLGFERFAPGTACC